jgi:hypothetical protein
MCLALQKRLCGAILRDDCETEQRDYGAIEKTVVIGLLLTRDEATLAAKRARLGAREPFRGFAGTVSAVIDLAGRYQNAGVQTLICGALKNDRETLELLASDVIRRFG